MYLSVSRDEEILDAELAGHWRAADLQAIDAELAAQSFAGLRALRVHVPEHVRLDIAGAWRLREWLQSATAAGLEVTFDGKEPGQLELIESTLSGKVHVAPKSSSESEFEPVSALGRQVTRRFPRVGFSYCRMTRSESPGLSSPSRVPDASNRTLVVTHSLDTAVT